MICLKFHDCLELSRVPFYIRYQIYNPNLSKQSSLDNIKNLIIDIQTEISFMTSNDFQKTC